MPTLSKESLPRTRSHCPACRTPYPRYTRRCAFCGRPRDQKSEAEILAESSEAERARQQARETRRSQAARIVHPDLRF